MAHIHTQPGQYDLTVSAYIIALPTTGSSGASLVSTDSTDPHQPTGSARTAGSVSQSHPSHPHGQPRSHAPAPRVLLHRHKTLGVLIQPGGHVELDETPWQTVAHEVREETGYDLDQLSVLQPRGGLTELTGDIVHPQPVVLRSFPFGDLPHLHTDLAFAFTTVESPRHEVGACESHEFVWLTREELRQLPDYETYPDVKQVIDHIFGHVMTTWEQAPATNYRLDPPATRQLGFDRA
ncbi:MAG: NUDIX domain-containing protein [Propionibacteriaceae bacterium]|jgi:8-oxo-dGTP pyrophosphatase MutT (NUDIX family)|nr:NUDIX domain-containing protein [Propionibacteriaceae bacterium]